jgi:hypothetical protein
MKTPSPDQIIPLGEITENYIIFQRIKNWSKAKQELLESNFPSAQLIL